MAQNDESELKRLARPFFYKYKGLVELPYLKTLITEHHLWFPRAKELNDPREAKPALAQLSAPQIARVVKRRFFREHGEMSLWERAHHFRIIDELAYGDPIGLFAQITKGLYGHLDEYRIYSMSKRWNNLAMWANYGGTHRGYCLEFANAGLLAMAQEVVYDDSLVVDISDESQLQFIWFYYKSREWRCEEEIRIILPNNWKGGQLVRIEPAWLNRIILGWKMPDAEREQIKGWAASRVPQLPVAEATFDLRAQTLTLG